MQVLVNKTQTCIAFTIQFILYIHTKYNHIQLTQIK